MTSEILSLAKYLASSRSEFMLSEMNQYSSKNYDELELYEILCPHFFDLGLFCSRDYKCTKFAKHPLPASDEIVRELEALFRNPELPPQVESLIESYIESVCGKNWFRGEKGTIIRENIVRQKEEYWKGKIEAKYPEIRIISYLLYHFPVYFCQYQYILFELLKGGLLFNRMSIIDVGSGPGTITLSTLDFIRKLEYIYTRLGMEIKLGIRIHYIEKERELVTCYNRLVSDFIRDPFIITNITIDKPIHSSVETAAIPENAELIIFSNVLAELKVSPHERAGVVENIASGSKNPTLMIIEPADLDNSRALRVTQHSLIKKGFTVYSPCSFIWGKTCTGYNCWSFQEIGNIKPPRFMQKISDSVESYRYVNTDMKFSYVILRKDGIAKHAYHAKGRVIAFSSLKKHIDRKINIAASVMSGNLGDERTLVFKLCDGTDSIPCYAVIPSYHITDNNRAIIDAGYGDIVEICGTLVRENIQQKSFNLFITRNTLIRRAG